MLNPDERDTLFRSQRWSVRDGPAEGTRIATVTAVWRGRALVYIYVIDLAQTERFPFAEAAIADILLGMQDAVLRKVTEAEQDLFL